LWRYEGANGIKTGYTIKARQCLVASANRNGEEFIAVILASEGRNVYDDAQKLLDYAFNNYQTLQVINKGQQLKKVSVSGGQGPVEIVADEDFFDTISKDEKPSYDYKFKIENLSAPVKAGQKVGTVFVYNKGAKVGEVKLVASNTVEPSLTAKGKKVLYPGILILMGLFLTFQFLKKYGRIKPKY